MPLLRGIARTAAIAGTATAVSNRVSRRQQNRWAQQEDQQYAQQQPQYAQQPQHAPSPPAARRRDPVEQLKGPRGTQVAGDPHRGRVRDPKGEDLGSLLNGTHGGEIGCPHRGRVLSADVGPRYAVCQARTMPMAP